MTARSDAPAILDDIEHHAAVLHGELARAVSIFVHGTATAGAAIPGEGPVTAATLELTVDGWASHVPADPAARDEVARLAVARYGPALAACPRTCTALSIDRAQDDDAAPADAPTVEAPLDAVAHAGPSALERALTRVDLPGGSVLFEAGDEGDSLYVIARGRLRVQVGDGDGAIVHELGPDQTVGEMALLTGDRRHGTVTAIRDSVLYRLSQGDFRQARHTHPAATDTMLRTLARRLVQPTGRGRAVAAPTNIAIVPAGTGAPVRAFAGALERFLSRHLGIGVATSERIDEAIGTGWRDSGPASRDGVALHDLLTGWEERHDHVLYVADDDRTAWTERCIREADTIVLVASAGASTALNDVERWLFDAERSGPRARLHLVLVEPHARATPVGTAPWLAERTVEMSHHVHLEWDAHFARLARFLMGNPVGLVLSGGAARAFAHVGVMQALRQASIPIDVIAATSAGALVGGQFAMGWTPERIMSENRQIFGVPRRKLLDFVPPRTSIIGSTRFNAMLDQIFGSARFEDLWIQFMCTTTDLTAARQLVHRRGRLRPYVRASCSLPMVMPPVTHDGHLLADGGIMNNVPVEPLLEVCDVGTLVVVNVTSPFYTADEAYNYRDSLTIRRMISSKFNPFSEKLVAPGIVDVLMRSLEIGSKSLEPEQIAKADVYVRPDVARYGYTNVVDMERIVEAGRVAAFERLAAWGTPAIPFT